MTVDESVWIQRIEASKKYYQRFFDGKVEHKWLVCRTRRTNYGHAKWLNQLGNQCSMEFVVKQLVCFGRGRANFFEGRECKMVIFTRNSGEINEKDD